ncbi:rhomboid-like protein [Microlunatus flavus]|uniref:Rhomboid family protein n=1 Tax=Microlunatus flavus TaxID=1036181 RepID=A0A1H9C5Y5_9ACTN|nr:rhomboid-like protein [Microlunatus flavus]SEP96088.1 hypothetical protein SAMN05421756_10271 [Microlunatus flavus]
MRAALAYASAFGVVATCVASRPAQQRDVWLAYLSTNLANLADHPVRALVGSAFVTDDPNLLGWTALALVGLAAAGEVLGDLRLGGLLAGAHVLGTLVSESVLASQVRLGLAPEAARRILDVGPSYVVAPALALGVVCGSTRGRVAAGLGFAVLAPHLFGGLTHLEVAAVGHVVAIGTALVLGPALVRDRRVRHGLLRADLR